MHTALKIFKRSSLQRLKILSVLGDSAYIFLTLWPTTLTIFTSTRRQRFYFFSVVAYSAQKNPVLVSFL